MGKCCVAVVGPPRSGTSMVAGLLHQLGVNMGEKFLPANPHNPKGFYEDIEFVAEHAKICLGVEDPNMRPDLRPKSHPSYVDIVRRRVASNELWGVKDPRLCMTLPLLAEVLADLKCKLLVIATVRAPHHSVRSLQKLHGGMTLEQAAERFGRYTFARSENTERWVQGNPSNMTQLLHVLYDQMVDAPGEEISRVKMFLGMEPGNITDELMAWVTPELRHQTSSV